MARWHGVVGYGTPTETPANSDIWVDVITEYPYTGNITRNARNLEDSGEKLNNDIVVGNTISIVADQYAVENFAKIKYVGWAGTVWTVKTVTVERPRLILNLGEVYNGPRPIEEPEEP